MTKRRRRPTRIKADQRSGRVARSVNQTLTTHNIGALPILNQILQRMKLEEFLHAYLPREDARTKLSSSRALMVLVRNILVARHPIYGVGEWATRYAPHLLGLCQPEVEYLNDDRVGRSLDKLQKGDISSLALAVSAHVVKHFGVELDQLHNDSTTISFYGAYDEDGQETPDPDRPGLTITWGHSKDHRPDLKQLLYILTVARDGGTPVYFTTASGNVTDDTTHRDTWDLLCQLTGTRDFLYVADSKLATTQNMNYINGQHGRFITVLPRTRKEDRVFRERLVRGAIAWCHVLDKTDDDDEMIDRVSVCDEPTLSKEGFQIWWYYSTRKAELDVIARTTRINRALAELSALRDRLLSPRTRIRSRTTATEEANNILSQHGVAGLIAINVMERVVENYHQATRGRPGKNTRYVKKTRTYCSLDYDVDNDAIAREEKTDGVFPLITNVESLTAREVYDAYKKQPLVEKRFSQLKTDFRVAPVYLQSVIRIEALLCVYFFVLMAEALLERELRQAMERKDVKSLPMYPEGRPCRRPTTRRLIDLFDTVERHTLQITGEEPVVMMTQLSRAQRAVLKLLPLKASEYGH